MIVPMSTRISPGIARQPPITARTVLLLGGVFVTTYDFFSVNISLPALARHLGATPAQLQWIVAAYGLCFGSALLAGSRLAEVWGAWQAFRRGMLAFAATTLAAGLVADAQALIACRALQGLAAAMLSSQVLTLLAQAPDPIQRQLGFVGYGIALGLGPAVGQLVAGLAIEYDPWQAGWRLPFLVNALSALLIGLSLRAPGGPPAARARLDWAGVAVLCASTGALVLPLIEGRRLHWPAWLLLSALAGAIGVAWVWRGSTLAAKDARAPGSERIGDESAASTAGAARAPTRLPLIDPAALGRPGFPLALVTVLMFYSINASFYLILSLTMSAHYGLRPLAATAVFTVLVAAFLVPTLLAQPIRSRFGSRSMTVGCLILAAGHGWLGFALSGGASLAALLAPLVVTGLAIGLVMAPLIAAAVAVGGGGSGVSGLTGSAQWIGNAVGAAALGSLYATLGGSGLQDAALAEAWVHAVCAAVALGVGALLGRWMPDSAKQ